MLRRSDERLPPGQHLARGWPVLHEGPIPPFDSSTWRFRCFGEVEAETVWAWEDFTKLPRITLTADFHCVPAWSKLDNTWEGVPFRAVCELARVKPTASHVLVHAPYGYSANVPLGALLDDDVVFALAHDGAPIEPKHGGPMRLVVPKLYGWKSVKWANAVEFLAGDARGFWEVRGYHNDADPWREERYAWQEQA
jgi:DMSO/TMAO reductase YedYZ molybdopterin-dependent catalytic subunit